MPKVVDEVRKANEIRLKEIAERKGDLNLMAQGVQTILKPILEKNDKIDKEWKKLTEEETKIREALNPKQEAPKESEVKS